MNTDFLFEGAKGGDSGSSGGNARSGRGRSAGRTGSARTGRGGGAGAARTPAQKAAETRRRKRRANMTSAQKAADTRANGPLGGGGATVNRRSGIRLPSGAIMNPGKPVSNRRRVRKPRANG